MKHRTLFDYVEEHGGLITTEIILDFDEPNAEFTLETKDNKLHIYNERGQMIARNENEFNDYLDLKYGITVRFCDYCGNIMQEGYTDDSGDFYNCELCFEKDMNERYGEGRWKQTSEDDECSSYYQYLNDNDEWEEEPSFYTQWY